MTQVVFREATAHDSAQIHALNHRVFAEEIGQHHAVPDGLLIDRFHAHNRYFVAVREGAVIGMISAHAGPEFSVTRRLPDARMLDGLKKPLEVRLLAIHSDERDRTVLAGLLWQVHDYAVSDGFSHLLISGIKERERMYRRLGFRPLGPAVPEGAANFIPMAMSLSDQMRTNRRRVELFERRWRRHSVPAQPTSLMPGPVSIHPRVERAFHAGAVSHRSEWFVDRFEAVRAGLRELAGGLEVAIFPGGGTLANDVVGANLRAAFGEHRGLVLANGEFGERLVRQAFAAGLRFEVLRSAWGEAWPMEALRHTMDCGPVWVWGVHIETSTGVLNDVRALVDLAHGAGAAVALDCVSSLGAVAMPEAVVPLLLSGVSGKSLGSYAGLALALRSGDWVRRFGPARLCPTFDIERMIAERGPMSTVPSSSLEALAAALGQYYGSGAAIARHIAQYECLGRKVRRALREAGIEPVARERDAAPNVTSFALPPGFEERCRAGGFQIAHESAYLKAKGWGQIATMGDFEESPYGSIDRLFRVLGLGGAM